MDTGVKYRFQGHVALTYPGYQHPEQEGVLQAEPNEVVDFGEAFPPGDGLWYDVSSGEAYSPPAVSDAVPAQGTAEDTEE
jgi:hypothetical protein